MKTKSLIFWKTPVVVLALLVTAGLVLGAQSEKKETASQQTTQKGFETAKQAADALIQAAEAFDVAALKEILGPGSEDLVASQDPVQDKSRAVEFAAKAKEKQSIEVDPKNANSATLSIGNEDWPLPIPIVKRQGKWYFDTKAGREETCCGASERTSWMSSRFARVCLAQEEYASQKHDDSTVHQYAKESLERRENRWPGWKNPDGNWGGPAERGSPRPSSKAIPTEPAVPRLLFQGAQGAGARRAVGRNGFHGRGCDDRGFALAAAQAESGSPGYSRFGQLQPGLFSKRSGTETSRS